MARKYGPALREAIDEIEVIRGAAGHFQRELPFAVDREQQATVRDSAYRIAKLMRRVPADIRARNRTIDEFWHFHDFDPDKVSPGMLWRLVRDTLDLLESELTTELDRLERQR